MSDLFSQLGPEKLPLEDAEVMLYRDVDIGVDHIVLLEELIRDTPWRQESVRMFGKLVPQPRLIAWYGPRSYSYSGITLEPREWTARLISIKSKVEAICDSSFNTVLLNYYRDQNDSMGMHSDDEPELGEAPSIASLSLGEERQFVFKHRHKENLKQVKLPLPNGSLLMMEGSTQKNWQHGIPKERKPCGPRVNLTFRRTFDKRN